MALQPSTKALILPLCCPWLRLQRSLYIASLNRAKKVSFLVPWFFVCYALPFIHVIPYLWFDFDREAPQVMWGMPVNPYMVDQTVIELMALLGALGAIGFAVGAGLGNGTFGSIKRFDLGGGCGRARSSLSLPLFLVWIGIGVLLSWLYAPRQTIFEARYTEGVAISQDWDFGSIWMISYITLVWCLADTLQDGDRARAKTKKIVFLSALVVVVGWLQLLRGDRESIPLVLASLLMSVRWSKQIGGHREANTRVWTRKPVVVGGVLMVVLAYLIGAIRSTLAGTDWKDAVVLASEMWASGELSLNDLIHGTWTAVLLTPLSVAGDYLAGSLPLKLGQDYLNYVLSLPPGFLANFLGYQRPIDAWHGPAWEMTYGIGGTHALVVPFMDFRAIGVVGVLALWGYVVARVDKRTSAGVSVTHAALWGTLVMVAPHWFWYGDKYFINAMLIWWGLLLLHRLAVRRRRLGVPMALEGRGSIAS